MPTGGGNGEDPLQLRHREGPRYKGEHRGEEKAGRIASLTDSINFFRHDGILGQTVVAGQHFTDTPARRRACSLRGLLHPAHLQTGVEDQLFPFLPAQLQRLPRQAAVAGGDHQGVVDHIQGK